MAAMTEAPEMRAAAATVTIATTTAVASKAVASEAVTSEAVAESTTDTAVLASADLQSTHRGASGRENTKFQTPPFFSLKTDYL